MKVSIIIPNYNGIDLLKKNLPKVFEAADYYCQKAGENIDIIIVDDASVDESRAFIKTQISSIRQTQDKYQNIELKLIENQNNLGFSSTVNKGADQSNGEIIVLLNTDVFPQIDFLEPLIGHFADENIFAVGCMDKSIEGLKTVLRGRGIGKWQRGFLVHKRGEVDKTNTLWVSGGSSAFRKSIWQRLGGFNQLYNPFYWEDIDLSYRALKSGYQTLFEPKSIVIHEHERGVIKSKYSSFVIKTIAYRNQFIFVWLNVTDLTLQFLHVSWLPYHFIRALARGDFAFVLGFFQAFVLLPKIIQSSFMAQKLFVKKDNTIMKEFIE